MRIDITEVIDRFPEFRVAVVIAEDLTISPQRSPDLAAIIADREAACRARWSAL
jgi:hypothetical protein